MTIAPALQQFHFLRPLWLLALPVLLAIAWWLARRQSREGDWGRLIDADLLPSLRLATADARSGSPWRWLAIAWSIAVLALAGPSWQRDEAPAFRAPAAWVLVLDLSPSMAATDVAPDRVTRARYAIEDMLGAAHDARVGLIVFSDEPYTVAPLTDDMTTVRSLLSPLAPGIMPSAGDHLAPALDRAAKLLASSGTRDRKVVVLTDGFDDPATAFAAAAQLHAQGADVDVIGIGTHNGAPVSKASGGFEQDAQGQTQLSRLDEDALRQLASSGGGRYADLAALPSLISSLASADVMEGKAEAAAPDIKVARWRDAGAWLLPAVLLMSALLARRAWL
jgi:Ca-activated chloride channel family protein